MSYTGFAGNLGAGTANAQNQANQMMAKFRNNRMVSGTTDFLYSNNLVAKVCFLILIIILFIIGTRLGMRLITWILSPNKSPILINGMRKGNSALRIYQDPKQSSSIPILRSVNERDGLEFTWSVWLFIEKINNGENDLSDPRLQHIFNKGSTGNTSGKNSFDDINIQGMNFPNNAPGLYLSRKENALYVLMNTFTGVLEEVKIPDIPMNKWINVVMRCKGRNMDTYINGTIVSRHVFESVPRQNYGDVWVAQHGGFSGMLSSLRYYNHALTGVEVENLVKAGPNLKADDSMQIFPPFIALRWFFQKPALAGI